MRLWASAAVAIAGLPDSRTLCVHRLSGLEKVKEVYLPFYVSTASLRSELASAELGFQEWGTVFNPTRRRFERQLVINWRSAVFDLVRSLSGRRFTARLHRMIAIIRRR